MIAGLTKDDIGAVLPLMRAVQVLHVGHRPDVFAADPPRDALRSALSGLVADPWGGVLIFRRARAILGYLADRIEDKPSALLTKAARIGHLKAICVAEHARRQGVGRNLVTALKERFRAAGCTHWDVTFRTFNRPSEALMAACGALPSRVRAEGIL